MRVLMLGWDFSPRASSGVGITCRGLLAALTRRDCEVVFVLPTARAEMDESGTRIIGVDQPPAASVVQQDDGSDRGSLPGMPAGKMAVPRPPEGADKVRIVPIPANLAPYDRPQALWHRSPTNRPVGARPIRGATSSFSSITGRPVSDVTQPSGEVVEHAPARAADPPPRDIDALLDEVKRYAARVVQTVADVRFDVIHAHDWMSFPAGQRLALASGRPLICHVHSTEFDRSAYHIDQRIYDVERAGVETADAVVAVSHLTRQILMRRYSVPAQRATVIYNAIDEPDATSTIPGVAQEDARARLLPQVGADERIVLFLGRMTLQKGPEYFLAAAQRVLQVEPGVRFVMAGSGDMVAPSRRLAEQLGIADRVLFTGFLQPDDVDRMFRCADLYVMPSVAEPYGMATLEAVSRDVPVVLSRQAGVGEVMRHVLRADFWDTDELANKIVAVLRHPPLHATLRERARFELRRLTWDDAADRCFELYRGLTQRGRNERARSKRAASRRGSKRSTTKRKPPVSWT